MRLLLHGGVVLTGPEWVPRCGDVLIAGERIAAVGPPGSFAGAGDTAECDVAGRLIVPGLVNAHTHSHTLLARGAARSWTLEDSLLHGGWMGAARSEELAELSALLAATEMIASGATGAFDLMAQTGGPEVSGLLAAARGYTRAGLRTVLAPMVADRSVYEAVPAVGECCPAPPAGQPAAVILARCAEFVEALAALPDGLVSAAVAPTILAHCTPELALGLHRLAVEYGLRVHTHLAESKPQALAGAERFGRSITAELGRLGLLDDRLTVAHAVWISDQDRVLLAEAGAVAVTVPGSNLRLGSGIADTRGALAAGVRLAVGTDGANSADALDVLDAARLAGLLSRVSTRPAVQWLTVEEVLSAATEGGAVACGWESVGRIEQGYAADLAFLDLGARGFLPPRDLANQLLTAARAADVTDVMVAGRWVYRDRVFPGLDVPAAEARFAELTGELLGRVAAVRTAATAESEAAATALAALRRARWPGERLLDQ